MSSDDPNGGPGTNQKSPEALESNMVSEIDAEQLPPELPLTVRARRHRCYRPTARHGVTGHSRGFEIAQFSCHRVVMHATTIGKSPKFESF